MPDIFLASIASMEFADTFLRMDATGVTETTPLNGEKGAGIVTSHYGYDERTTFLFTKQPDGTYTIQSTFESPTVPKAYLSMDATTLSLSHPEGTGGVVGCRLNVGSSWERFYLKEVPGQLGVYAIGSAHFDNVYLRMTGNNVQTAPTGGGVVDCRYNNFSWEHFRLVEVKILSA